MSTNTGGIRYGEDITQIEPRGIEHVEPHDRHGKVSSIFTLWFGANVELATLTTGTAAVSLFGLNFKEAFFGLLIGNILGAAVLGLVSVFGPRLGVPQMVHSRSPFGFWGNFVPGTLNLISGVMWFAVNTVLGSFAFETLFHTQFLSALVVMVLLQVIVAVYGYNMIHAVERVMAVVLTLVFVLVSIYAFSHAHYAVPFNAKSLLGQYSGVTGSFIEAVGLAFSYLLGWSVYGSDYTRYLSDQTPSKSVFGYVFSSNFLAAFWLELVGVALATVFPAAAQNPDPIALLTGIDPHWLVSAALIAVLIGTVTANVLNIYSSSLSALVINVPVKRWMAAILVGIVGGVLSFVARKSYYLDFENFLFLLGYWLAPWAAIVLVDFFVVHKGQYTGAVFYHARRVVRPGLIAWIVGVGTTVPFWNQALYQGVVAKAYPQLGDLTYYVSFFVAGLLYWIIGRVKGPE